jgi:hypothetical protein
MNRGASRKNSITAFVVILFSFMAIGMTFAPLWPCRYCTRERKEIKDWLSEPVLRGYLKDHPEAVDQARADLRRLDERCVNCFHGRVPFWSAVFASQR